MTQNQRKVQTCNERRFYALDLLLIFRNTLSFAMTLTNFLTVLTKKAMIFSKMID